MNVSWIKNDKMVFMVTGTTKYSIAIGRRPRILKHLSSKYLKKIYSVSVTVLLHTE